MLLLLEQNHADIESPDTAGYTPLYWAATNDFEAAVRLLLLEGAVINAGPWNRNDATPLLSAVTHGHEAVVRLLLTRGEVDVNGNNHGGPISLWLAARDGKTDRATVMRGLTSMQATTIRHLCHV